MKRAVKLLEVFNIARNCDLDVGLIGKEYVPRLMAFPAAHLNLEAKGIHRQKR